jgi:hypothetical protein
MSRTTLRSLSLALIGAAVAVSCGDSDEVVEQLHVRFEWLDFVDDTFITTETGCMNIEVGADGEIKADDPFWSRSGSGELEITRRLLPEGLRVTGVSENAGGAMLVDRLYSPEFIRTGATDIIDVIPPRGREAKIGHRGVPNCDDDIDVFPD